MGIIYLILAFSLNSLANVLLKLAATKGFHWQGLGLLGLVRENILVIAALASFGLNLLFYFLALERVALSVAYPIMNVMSIVIVFAFAVWYFHDSLSLWQVVGYTFMVSGMVMVFYFAPKG